MYMGFSDFPAFPPKLYILNLFFALSRWTNARWTEVLILSRTHLSSKCRVVFHTLWRFHVDNKNCFDLNPDVSKFAPIFFLSEMGYL